MRPASCPSSPRQRGVALIEALVALLIMAFGMIALAGLQSNMRRSADLAKQRGEAIRLAQQHMEDLRDYAVLTRPAGAPIDLLAYADIADASDSDNAGNTTFTLTRTVRSAPDGAPLKAVNVEVDWTDRAGDAQFVIIDSFITGADPSLSGSLGITPDAAPLRRPGGRQASIPLEAKDLGNRRSALVPGPLATVAWIFNNITGDVIGRCTVAMGTSSASLTAASTGADVGTCSYNMSGYLLSGFVRFSFDLPPSPDRPVHYALPNFDMEIVQADAPPPTPGNPAPSRPVAPSYQCFDNAPVDASFLQPYVSYYCIVFPNTDATPNWSGKLNISGIGLDGDQYKICRYSADYDGDALISNAEHPLNYYRVSGSLPRQNFLVIRASAACPAGPAVDAAAGIFSDTTTVQHQPG
jgi:Tfp pilus assembly protein PilV